MDDIAVTPDDFAREFWLLKKHYLSPLVSHNLPFVHDKLLEKLNLSQEQKEVLPELLNAVITAILYTVLLGLDGTAQIGEKQVVYTILDEVGNKICGEMGEVEVSAYEYFHGQKQ
ncbi:hypothetical protein ACVWYF_004297 [Hymenobacter sp. UYAg731]